MAGRDRDGGWIEVVCGPMFSGKTEELLRRMRRAQIAQQGVRIFKPKVDRRYSDADVVSHDAQRIPARPITHSEDMLHDIELSAAPQVVGVDEAQFFDAALADVVEALAERGHRVVVAGLDTDYQGRTFEIMADVIARAEYVTKLLAICIRCGRPANRSLRVGGGHARVELGAEERYIAACRRCFCAARAETPSAGAHAPAASMRTPVADLGPAVHLPAG